MNPDDPPIHDVGTTIASRYRTTGLVGTYNDGGLCDHPGATRSADRRHCTCVICGRCRRHTGNSNQGHYWAFCQVTKTRREFHLCCPGNCELEAAS